jgi:hypothetical protein
VKRKVSWRRPRPELGCREKGKKKNETVNPNRKLLEFERKDFSRSIVPNVGYVCKRQMK